MRRNLFVTRLIQLHQRDRRRILAGFRGYCTKSNTDSRQPATQLQQHFHHLTNINLLGKIPT